MSDAESGLLAGKTAIITGGGGGIGAGIARAFGAHGARVVVAEIDPERAASTVAEIQDAGGAAVAVVADVRERPDIDRIVAAGLDAFGQIDVLVNNVGVYSRHPAAHFHETDEEDWAAMYDMNLGHVFRMTRAVLPHMIERGAGGSIITLSTVEAFRAVPGQVVYGAFNAGVAQFTRSLALDVAEFGIRVNDIAPDVTRSVQLPYDRWLSESDQAKIPLWVPLGRLGEPADAAGVAVFLASELSGFVTGASIPVDGGTLAAGGWYRTTHGTRSWTNRPFDP